jgi:hypothetical protein
VTPALNHNPSSSEKTFTEANFEKAISMALPLEQIQHRLALLGQSGEVKVHEPETKTLTAVS